MYVEWLPLTAFMFLIGTFIGVGVSKIQGRHNLLHDSIENFWLPIDSEVLLVSFLPGLIYHDAYRQNSHLFRVAFSQCAVFALFDAYNACTDEDFLQYIKRIQHEYQDGTLDEQNFTPDSLMVRANNFYKMRMSTSSGRGWEEPSEKDAQILALQTQLVKTQRESNKIKAQIKFTGGGDKSPKNPKPAWLKNNTKPSKATLTKPKSWNGRQWYWCDKSTGGKCNGRWVCHLPSECEGGKRKDKSNSSESEKKKKARKMLNLQQATIDADAEADS